MESIMGLSGMKVFDFSKKPKSRVKRLSSGEFLVGSDCGFSAEVAENYINSVKFKEAVNGSLVIACKSASN